MNDFTLNNKHIYPPDCDDGVFLVITTLFPNFESKSTL